MHAAINILGPLDGCRVSKRHYIELGGGGSVHCDEVAWRAGTCRAGFGCFMQKNPSIQTSPQSPRRLITQQCINGRRYRSWALAGRYVALSCAPAMYDTTAISSPEIDKGQMKRVRIPWVGMPFKRLSLQIDPDRYRQTRTHHQKR